MFCSPARRSVCCRGCAQSHIEEVRDIVRAQRATPDAAYLRAFISSPAQTRDALAASDAAAIASGTATLEAALLGTPMVIVYKESAVNWHTLGRLINVDHFGLVNLVAGETRGQRTNAG